MIHLLIGVLSCAVFVLVVRQAGLKWEAIIYAVGLVVAALIYVGFAIAGGAAPSWIAVESGGLLLFSLVALLGVKVNVWFLSSGWAAHAVWDIWLHRVLNVGLASEWYPVMCLGFDLFLAGYIATTVMAGLVYGKQNNQSSVKANHANNT